MILYEMLVGYTPFFSDNPAETCQKILHFEQTFQIPSGVSLSNEARDLIQRLVTNPSISLTPAKLTTTLAERLGVNGVWEIKAHPFFYGIKWKSIRNDPSPYTPKVHNTLHLSNLTFPPTYAS